MKLTKILVGSAIALPATIVPLSTITSCAQSWGNLSAFSIGGATTSSGPYAELSDSLLDHDGVAYSNYLQSNYAINQSSNTAYAYSSPMKWNSDEDVHEWEQGETGWYSFADPVFNSYASYKDGDDVIEKPNAQNAALSANISFVNSIGQTISGYISNSLRYQASQVNKNDEDNTAIKAAWGANSKKQAFTLNYGAMGSGIIHNFFEFNFASANLNGPGKAEAMLRPANVSFNFLTFPLPTYSFTGQTRNGLSSDFITMIEGETVSSYYNSLKHYTQKSEEIDDDDEGNKHIDYVFKNVPVLIRVNNLTQSYMNPQKSGSFLVTDYYSTDNQVRSTVGNQWKEILNEKTGCGLDEAIPQYRTFKWDTGERTITPGSIQDTRVTKLEPLQGNDFIALIDYSLKVHNNKKDEDVAAINGVSNIFPACWLELFDDREDWYEETTKDSGQYMLKQSTINHFSNKFNSIVTRSASGQLPSDDEGLNLLTFLGYMFAQTGNNITIGDGSNGALLTLDEILD